MPGQVFKVHLVDVKNAAKMLGISVRGVWRLAKSGQLPKPIRIGGSRRWRVNDLMKHIYARDAAEEEK